MKVFSSTLSLAVLFSLLLHPAACAQSDDETRDQIAQLQTQVAELQAKIEYLISQNTGNQAADSPPAQPGPAPAVAENNSTPMVVSEEPVIVERAPTIVETVSPSCYCQPSYYTAGDYYPAYRPASYYYPDYYPGYYADYYPDYGFGYGLGYGVGITIGGFGYGLYPGYRGFHGHRHFRHRGHHWDHW